MNRSSHYLAHLLETDAERTIATLYYTVKRNGAYLQPLRHHSYAVSYRSGNRDRSREGIKK